MIGIETATDAAEVSVHYGEAHAVTAKNLLGVMRTIVNRVAATARKKVRRGSGVLNHRTGNLGRAIFGRVELSENDIVGRVGVDLAKARYGRIQELGGTVRPVNGQFLAVPLGPALTGNGVARCSARQFLENPSILGFDGAFIAKGVVFGKTGRDRIEPVFALKRSVTIPARSYLRSSVEDERAYIMQALTGAVSGLGEGAR